MTLTILSKPQVTRDYLVYDLEWIPGTLQVRVVGVFDKERGYRCYKTVQDFLVGELTTRNQGKWFYAHFGGGADFQFVLSELIGHKSYEIDGCFSGSSLIIGHVRHGHHSWQFLDSYWLIRMSLAKIGEWLHMPKTGPDKEIEDAREWYAKVPLPELIEYNEQDCRILYAAIQAVENAVLAKGGILQMTLASTAMTLFRRKYLTQDIPTNETINDIARSAYIASRVEVFTQDCNSAYYYDINSSFPYAMTLPQPGKFKKYYTKKTPERLLYDDYPSLIHATVHMPDCYLPPIPLRHDGRILFPHGVWRGWFTNIDIALLLQNEGKVLSISEAIEFEPFFDMKHYAEDLYASRLSADSEAEKITYKLLLNSLYGKTAESSLKLSLHVNPSEKVLARLTRDQMKFPGVWVEPTIANVPHVHVPIAAQVTAIARRRIYEPMSKTSEVYYCDTDGFATSDTMPQGKELGELKLEKLIVNGEFLAPKVYHLNAQFIKGDKLENKQIYKAKGFSLGQGEKAAKRFSDLAQGQSVQIERMRRIRELLNYGKSVPEEIYVNKKLQNEVFPKRFYYPDGDSRPWHTSEIVAATKKRG